ncbi:OsmC family protein [Winogradskyella ursingii]|uniref:OsmC family protein n=1 Tax=Winogradskyella ursingii TaxID=2686079 RepID=UPI0015CEF087|nr:OsmC family protein [Winogradskyella ursingii]
MNFTRQATAEWKGSGKEGQGHITTESEVLNNTPYDFTKRFEDEKGTNPEELIGAAHAGCYTMQLSFLLGESGYTPDHLETNAKVTFDDGEITKIALDLKGKVPNIESDEFNSIAEKAKNVCPVSKLLKAEITLNSSLES